MSSSKSSRNVAELLVDAQRIVLALLDSGGETNEAIEKAIYDFSDAGDECLYRYFLIKNALEKSAELIDEEAKRLQKRRQLLLAQVERFKSRSEEFLLRREELGLETKVKTDLFSCVLQERDVLDAPEAIGEWPQEFVKVELKLEKKAIFDAIKAGQKFDGFGIKKTRFVVFR